MPSPRLSPEQQARVRIDRMLQAAGWVVLDYADADFAAGPGVAIREVMTPKGPVDYLLVAERKVAGSLEGKKEGDTLRQVGRRPTLRRRLPGAREDPQPPALRRPPPGPLHLDRHRDPVHEPPRPHSPPARSSISIVPTRSPPGRPRPRR